MSFSVVTLVKGRKKQLENMLESIKQSTIVPSEIVIVWMEKETQNARVEDEELNIKQLYLEKGELPLAKARNLGFESTSYEHVVFLDVDCICSPTLLDGLLTGLRDKAITSAYARYLPYIPLSGLYPQIEQDALSHHKRAKLEANTPLPHKKFWSLVFALRKDDFYAIGGFDEKFTGYGGEDTDFAERFNKQNFAFILINDEVLHQYHFKYSPPLNYLEAIVENANLFYQKHGYFPMYSWLKEFCKRNYVTFDETQHVFNVLRLPHQLDIELALSTKPY